LLEKSLCFFIAGVVNSCTGFDHQYHLVDTAQQQQ
jgi:hypothetical protein